MWDIETIIRENNLAAIQAMMRGQEIEAAQEPDPREWPLAWLARKLQIGPPLLSELRAGFTDIDALTSFLKLLRRLLPEHEAEIMAERRSRRAHKFAWHFSRKYFPLPPLCDDLTMGELCLYMPINLMAMSYDAYHELDMRPSYLMLLSLVVYPYEGDERDIEDDGIEKDKTLMKIFGGARVPLIEKVAGIIGKEQALKIPCDGWAPQDIHGMVDGTKYEGAAYFADWACSQTGCFMLDSCHDEFDYSEGMGDPALAWSDRNIRILTEQYPRVKLYREKIDGISEWMEAAPAERFAEMLSFMLTRKPRRPKKFEPAEHIWLDIADMDSEMREEGEDDDEADGPAVRPATAADIAGITRF